MTPGLHVFADDAEGSQSAFDVAVVMPTLMRPTLIEAVRSIYAQTGGLRIQVMIGVDRCAGSDAASTLETLRAERPHGCAVHVLWPGYSTSERHGGFGKARDGGVLRSVLSQLANAPRIAYLDDDNWWAPDHLAGLVAAIEGCDWAWSGRMFVHPRTLMPICADEWESVGVDAGIFQARFGGFVDPNCLMVDRTRIPHVLDLWNQPLANDPEQMTADRTLFSALRFLKHRCSGRYSAFYVVRETDGLHQTRLEAMGARWHAAAGVPLCEAGQEGDARVRSAPDRACEMAARVF